MQNAAQSESLQAFLRELHSKLRSLNEQDRNEVLLELRSHVLERAAGDLSEPNIRCILGTLGSAAELARVNLEMRPSEPLLPKHRVSIMGVIKGGVYWVSVSLASVAGYGFAACWLLTAIAKPFAPDRVGLWRLADPSGDLSLSLGRHGPAVIGQDLLG